MKNILFTIVMLHSLASSLLADNNLSNTVLFTFDSSIKIVDVRESTLSNLFNTPVDNNCTYGIVSKNHANNSISSNSDRVDCIAKEDIIFNENNITIFAGRSDDENISSNFFAIPNSSNAMLANQNPFDVDQNSTSCAVECLTNTQPKSMNFYIGVDIEFEVDGNHTTCAGMVIGQQGDPVGIKGVAQMAVTAYTDEQNTSDAASLVFGSECDAEDEESTEISSKKCDNKWSAMGKSVVKDVGSISKIVHTFENHGNMWWIAQGESLNPITIPPYYAPSWLAIPNENYVNAVQCSNNYTLFMTYNSDKTNHNTFVLDFSQRVHD